MASATNQDDSSGGRQDADLAANVVRQKINQLYQAAEPQARAELAEVGQENPTQMSKHQRFMHELSTSGKSLADIQTQWHNYYVNLPDAEKHAVWEEFYKAHDQMRSSSTQPAQPKPKRQLAPKSVADIKDQLLQRSRPRRKLSTKHHVQSIAFGLGMGCVAILILLFGFFNDRFIAPFITPSRTVSSTPIILDPNSTAAGPNPEIVIPKINVEIPVVYNQPSVDEKAIQQSLENGVVHYASTPSPGEKGNIAIVGHSSNNILNKGHYKFAFVLLSRLTVGDTFYLTKDGKRYAYRVYQKPQIVDPNDVAVLGPTDKTATATLITCDPPGTSLHRLVVVGEQISPDPNSDLASTAKTTDQPTVLAGNAPSLWSRLVHWLTT